MRCMVRGAAGGLLLFSFFTLVLQGAVFAFAFDDGFGSAKQTEAKHFVIWRQPAIEPAGLVRKLQPDAALSETISDEDLSRAVDALFLRVCDILGMGLPSYKGAIKICQNRQELSSLHSGLFEKKLKPDAGSFYAGGASAIYISADDFTTPVLGHEMAHCVVSGYFVVAPPAKIQEILAGYVEYQLRGLK